MERPLGPLPHLPSSTTTSSFNNTFVPRTNATITTTTATTATTATRNNLNTPAMGRGRGRGRTLPAWMTQQSGGGGDGFVGGGQQAHVPANRLTTSAFPVSTANNTHATTTTNATTTNNATNTTANNANNATTTHNAPSPSTTATTTPPPHVPDAPWTNTMTLQGHTGAVLCVCLNEAGSHCLTGGQDRTVKLWNPRNSNPTKNILTTFNDGRITHPVADIAVLPGSKRFVTCGGTTRALLWDLNTKQLSRKFNGHSLRVNCVEHGASGDVLFTGGYDRLVVAHDLRARTEIQTLPICKDSVESLLVVGHDILASDANGCVYHHDVRAGRLRVDNYHAPIGHMSVSPDGRCLALSCQDGRVRLVERATGLLLGTFAGSHVTTDYKIGCTFADQGRTVVTGSENGQVVMYDVMSEQVQGVLRPPVLSSVSNRRDYGRTGNEAVCTVGLSRDYHFLISAGYDGLVHVWKKNV